MKGLIKPNYLIWLRRMTTSCTLTSGFSCEPGAAIIESHSKKTGSSRGKGVAELGKVRVPRPTPRNSPPLSTEIDLGLAPQHSEHTREPLQRLPRGPLHSSTQKICIFSWRGSCRVTATVWLRSQAAVMTRFVLHPRRCRSTMASAMWLLSTASVAKGSFLS